MKVISIKNNPNYFNRSVDEGDTITIFLSGGYQKDWRSEVIAELEKLETTDDKLVLYDPRGSVEAEDISSTIKWENRAIESCNVYGCYLDNSGIHAVSLYELGKATTLMSTVVVGFEDGYNGADYLVSEVSYNAFGSNGTIVRKGVTPKQFAEDIYGRCVAFKKYIELQNEQEETN